MLAIKNPSNNSLENINKIGNTNISNIGDGTMTGAIAELHTALSGKSDTSHVHRAIIKMGYASHTMSCEGNAATEGNLTVTIPSGYTAVAILEARVDYPNSLVISYLHVTPAGAIRYFVYNHSSNTINNNTAFNVILVKTDYVQL